LVVRQPGTRSSGSYQTTSAASTFTGARSQTGRIVGTAQPRDWSRLPNYYLVPWYAPSYAYPFGYASFTPWGYYSSFGYGVSGYGFYDPFFSPYGLGAIYGYPYGWGYGGGGGGYYADDQDYDDDRPQLGSIRLRANPRDAKVYVDGTLAGTVDDFDGLTGHLRLEEGPHQLELRLDGYETFAAVVTVEPGKTKTQRIGDLKQAR
jgi:hypothetical protein